MIEGLGAPVSTFEFLTPYDRENQKKVIKKGNKDFKLE
jgi:hypothetical protein